MPNIGSILLTVVSYFIAFSIITDKFNQLEEKKESIHLSLVDWSNRWSVANIIKVKEDFQEKFLTKDIITTRSQVAFFKKKEQDFFEEHRNILTLYTNYDHVQSYMKKEQMNQAKINSEQSKAEQIPESFLNDFIGNLDNVTAKYNILLDLFQTNEEPIEKLMEIYKEMETYFLSGKCPDDLPGCNEKQKIMDFFIKGGMIGELHHVLKNFKDDTCNKYTNINTEHLPKKAAKISEKANELYELAKSKNVTLIKRDHWNLHVSISDMEKRVEQLDSEEKYFTREMTIYHDRGFIKAEEIYVKQLDWMSANRTFWSLPKLIAKSKNRLQFDLIQFESWEKAVERVEELTLNGNEMFEKYLEHDKSPESVESKKELVGMRNIISGFEKRFEIAEKKVEKLPETWNDHTHAFKEQWWMYTGEMGWSIKNVQTTGMDLGWFS